MKKFRMFIDARKEEKWLNKMIQKGWLCKKVNTLGIYSFEKTKTLEHAIRLDSQTFKSPEMYEQYRQLHEDYGWQHIGGSRRSPSQYWVKSADGLDELFSDTASEKAYFQRLMRYYGSSTLLFIILTFGLAISNNLQYANLKSAYLTPGLWDKEGKNFLTAFLFETPFALLRFSIPWFIIICGLAFAITYLRYKRELEKTA